MSAYPQSDDLERGTWKAVEDHSGPPNSALFVCPNCGMKMSLDNHEIDGDGLVSPIVRCPNDNSCSFEKYIELKGWEAAWSTTR